MSLTTSEIMAIVKQAQERPIKDTSTKPARCAMYGHCSSCTEQCPLYHIYNHAENGRKDK